MERILITSNNLKSVGYDAETETLEIEFKNGDIYQYTRVSEYVYISLMNATSKGSYFAKNIRNNRNYGCVQVWPISRQLR